MSGVSGNFVSLGNKSTTPLHMDYVNQFDQHKNFASRVAEVKKLRERYPQRVPVLVDRYRKTCPKLLKNKFLVPVDMTMGAFIHRVRQFLYQDNKAPLDPSMSVLGFVSISPQQNTIPSANTNLFTIYKDYQRRDGFLVILIDLEQTFG
jgi:hypothetical protein